MIYLDTHVVAWLYGGRVDLFPELARSLIEANDLWISPMVGLELQYLYEIERFAVPADLVLESLAREIQLEVCDLPFARVAAEAWSQDWTRDPFDRIVVSHARLNEALLVTKDEEIQRAYDAAVWAAGGRIARVGGVVPTTP